MPDQKRRLLRSAASRLATLLAVVLLATLFCATLVRFAPGFGVDERELDSRRSAESLAALRAQHAGEQRVTSFYFSYLAKALRGDLGISSLFSQPISRLLAQRLPLTLVSMGAGLALAWILALACALLASAARNRPLDAVFAVTVAALVSLPAAVVGLLIAIARKPVSLAIALMLAPVLYRWCRNILQRSWNQPWTVAARAKGLSTTRILFGHVVPFAAPQLIALAGVSLNMAFGAVLPVEVVADSAGVGQLAWQAAMGRDLPLLVTITALVTVLTLSGNAAAALAHEALQPVTP